MQKSFTTQTKKQKVTETKSNDTKHLSSLPNQELKAKIEALKHQNDKLKQEYTDAQAKLAKLHEEFDKKMESFLGTELRHNLNIDSHLNNLQKK